MDNMEICTALLLRAKTVAARELELALNVCERDPGDPHVLWLADFALSLSALEGAIKDKYPGLRSASSCEVVSTEIRGQERLQQVANKRKKSHQSFEQSRLG
jgi:hypothetical protein